MTIEKRENLTAFLSFSSHFQSRLGFLWAIIIKTFNITRKIIELLIISAIVKIFEIVFESTKYLFPTAAKIAPTDIDDLASNSPLGM